jgi:hypothetical protein
MKAFGGQLGGLVADVVLCQSRSAAGKGLPL